MNPADYREPAVPKRNWAGLIVTALPVLFLTFDSVIHLAKSAPVLQSFAELGFDGQLARKIGVVEVLCLALYVFPSTSVLGAILLTGYLGGAVAAHLRIGNPLFGYTLFPVYMGILLWTGLVLRNSDLRRWIPVLKVRTK